MTYQNIEYSHADSVAIIRLNKPETLNSMSAAMAQEILDALKDAAGNSRALIICGAGRGFCSGASLSEGLWDIADPQRDVGVELETIINPMIEFIRDMPIPIITAVKGPAAGVGCSLALMGDLIIAGKSAYFLQAFRGIGLVPDGGSAYILSRAIGRVRALEMMLLGKKLAAQQAFEYGLVTKLVEDDEVETLALDYAKELAAGPTKALGMIRQASWAALDSTLTEHLARERTLQRDACRTDDFIEGVAAFREKRPARFQGR